MTATIGRTKILLGAVNKAVRDGGAGFFEECDQSYERRIRAVAEKISGDVEAARLIMLSGPSASGKTTTSLKIKQELEQLGVKAITISMDDFFKNRDDTPILPDGSRDFESLKALDSELLDEVLTRLITDGRAELPVFNFKKGMREEQRRLVELPAGSVAVVEGLHALDPAVTDALPRRHMLKIYVSVSSDFVDDQGGVILCARDVRLIRRTLRDYRFRGSSPENTLDMWDTVCRGEDMYVRPFKKFADVTLNSVFRCEPCLFGEMARGLYQTVGSESEHCQKARAVMEAAALFEPLPVELIPNTCMLREFIGGSVYFNKSAGKKG